MSLVRRRELGRQPGTSDRTCKRHPLSGPVLESLQESPVGMLLRCRALGQHQGSFPVVGCFGETLGICLQQHVQLFRRAVTRGRHVYGEPPLLVAHLGGIRPKGEHLPAQIGADVVGEDNVERIARPDAAGNGDGGRVGVDEGQKELFFHLGLHLAVALRQNMDRQRPISILDGCSRGSNREYKLDQTRPSADVALGRDGLVQDGRRDVVGHRHWCNGEGWVGRDESRNIGPLLFLAENED